MTSNEPLSIDTVSFYNAGGDMVNFDLPVPVKMPSEGCTPTLLCRLCTVSLPLPALSRLLLLHLLTEDELGNRVAHSYYELGQVLGKCAHSIKDAVTVLRKAGLVTTTRTTWGGSRVAFSCDGFIRWAAERLGSRAVPMSSTVAPDLNVPSYTLKPLAQPPPTPEPAAATPSVVGKPVPVAPLPAANTVAPSPAPTTQPEMPQITTPEVIDWHAVPDEEVLPPSPYIKALLEREKAGERLPQKEFDEVTEYVIACEQERMNREHPTEWYYNSNLTPPPGVTGSPMKGWHWDPASGYPCPQELEMAWGPEVDASEERNATIALAGKTSEEDEFSSGTDTDETDIGHGVVCNPDL